MDGIVIVKKEKNITSQGVVNRIKHIFGVKKAGHTGTLDPMATGVLPVLVGRAVKASEYMLCSDKYYRATMLLGITTDTEDITGNILTECSDIPCAEKVISTAAAFVGDTEQIPPMYSALKVGGKKLCDLARAGIEIERTPRTVTVYSLDVSKINEREYSLDIHCSKGTYIRTLIADIGKALGCGAVMSALERTRAGIFELSLAHTLSELEEMSEGERSETVIPVERVFEKYPEIILEPFFARLGRSGLEIYLKKIGRSASVGELFRLSDGEGFFALGEVREYEGGLAVKPIKQFDV